MIDVSAAFIRNGSKILICRRGEGKNCSGMWEFPGGKREKGETGEQALERECMEELGIKISVGPILAETVYEYPQSRIHLCLYEAKIIEGIPVCLDHSKILWVKEHNLTEYDFCPADVKLIHILLHKKMDNIDV